MDGEGINNMEGVAATNHSSCPPAVERRRSLSEPTSPKTHTPLGKVWLQQFKAEWHLHILMRVILIVNVVVILDKYLYS